MKKTAGYIPRLGTHPSALPLTWRTIRAPSIADPSAAEVPRTRAPPRGGGCRRAPRGPAASAPGSRPCASLPPALRGPPRVPPARLAPSGGHSRLAPSTHTPTPVCNVNLLAVRPIFARNQDESLSLPTSQPQTHVPTVKWLLGKKPPLCFSFIRTLLQCAEKVNCTARAVPSNKQWT